MALIEGVVTGGAMAFLGHVLTKTFVQSSAYVGPLFMAIVAGLICLFSRQHAPAIAERIVRGIAAFIACIVLLWLIIA